MQKLAIIREDVSPLEYSSNNFECDNEKTGEYKIVEKAQGNVDSKCKCNKEKCCKDTQNKDLK
jgi:hypothetical protein